MTIQAFEYIVTGLEEKNNVSYQLVISASCSHILFAQGYFLLVFVNDLVRGEVHGPLPIGLKITCPARRSVCPKLVDRTFFPSPTAANSYQ